MLDFIVVGLPRSATTWAANWLTTEKSTCWHDATGFALPEELDKYNSMKKYKGISCTGAWMWKEWFENHTAKKIILERDTDEINASLVELGIPPLTTKAIDYFNSIQGYRVKYTDLFDKPKEIWNRLLPNLDFDGERHEELLKMNIQPIERVMVPDAEYVRRMLNDLGLRINEIV